MFFHKITMPAALLLLLCAACNSQVKKRDAYLVKDEISLARENKYQPEALSTSTSDTAAFSNGLVGNTEDRAGKPAENKNGQKNLPNPPGKRLSAIEDWDKKIVKTADLNVEVKSYRNFNDILHNTVKRLGGYVAREEQTQSSYKIENTIVIKVPVAQFDEAVLQLSPESEKLIAKKINAEDVTMEVVDTKSRLEAKQRARSRYLDLLRNAKNMEEILQVQNEIDGIQEQMESASGRIGYLSHEAAFSTINLDFYQVLDAGAQEDPQPSFFHKFIGAFKIGLDWASGLVVGFVALWPLWIVAGLIFWGFRKWQTGRIKAVEVKKIPS